MSSVAEIEKAIAKLSPQEFVELEAWFDQERHQLWDRQLEADGDSGALNSLIQEVSEDISSGKTQPADAFFNHS